MKIKSKLIIIALLPTLSLLISSALHYHVSNAVNGAQKKVLLVDEFSRGLSILTIITLEHDTHYEQRAHTQWEQKFDNLNKQLKKMALAFKDPKEQVHIKQLFTQFETLSLLFEQYGPHMPREQFNTENVNWRSFAERLTNRIQQELQLAINIARKELPDLILLDVMMPGMDGYEICKILK